MEDLLTNFPRLIASRAKQRPNATWAPHVVPRPKHKFAYVDNDPTSPPQDAGRANDPAFEEATVVLIEESHLRALRQRVDEIYGAICSWWLAPRPSLKDPHLFSYEATTHLRNAITLADTLAIALARLAAYPHLFPTPRDITAARQKRRAEEDARAQRDAAVPARDKPITRNRKPVILPQDTPLCYIDANARVKFYRTLQAHLLNTLSLVKHLRDINIACFQFHVFEEYCEVRFIGRPYRPRFPDTDEVMPAWQTWLMDRTPIPGSIATFQTSTPELDKFAALFPPTREWHEKGYWPVAVQYVSVQGVILAETWRREFETMLELIAEKSRAPDVVRAMKPDEKTFLDTVEPVSDSNGEYIWVTGKGHEPADDGEIFAYGERSPVAKAARLFAYMGENTVVSRGEDNPVYRVLFRKMQPTRKDTVETPQAVHIASSATRCDNMKNTREGSEPSNEDDMQESERAIADVGDDDLMDDEV